MSANSTARNDHPLFPTGRVVATPGALRLLADLQVNPLTLLGSHVYGDWSDMCEEDQALNRIAVAEGGRIFSSFDVGPERKTKLWVITEWNRSVTTVLRPEDY